MTALDYMKRFSLLQQYIDTLEKIHLKISNYNEDMGEGNPEARMISMIIEEYSAETMKLIEKLESIKINE